MLKTEIGALILRLTLGAIFFIHGVVKFQGGIENTAVWFESLGLLGVTAYGVALLEMIGGILLIIGLATRLVAALFAVLMIGATVKVKLAIGFLGNGQMAGYELDLAFLVIAIYLVINGSKLFSLSKLIFHRDSTNAKAL